MREEVAVRNPLVDPNLAVPDYVARAFQASGGLQLWARTRQIRADCVVTFYKPDGSFHLTEYQCEISPWPSSILISSSEPQGDLRWSFSGSDFELSKTGAWKDAFPAAVRERDFAEVVLDIMIAPIRLLDYGAVFTRVYDPVKIEGLWHYPIERRGPDKTGVGPYWSRVVFYQSTDNSLLDMIWFASADGDKSLAVRGYDYREIEKGGVLVPGKIEILKTDAREFPKERLAKVDWYGF